jgi:molybdopterin-binding protein
MDDLITAADAAKLLHLHVKRVQHLARTGKLPATRFGHKWLFSRSKLLAMRNAPAGGEDQMGALEISARNRLRGRIVSITADGVMAEVRVQVGDQEIVSIITRSSAERLHLNIGDEVFAVMKSTEVMIAKSAG